MPKVQEYLNINYKDKTITELNLSGWNDKDNKWEAIPNWEKLTGELDLSGFPNLEKLNCSYNQITFLNLTNCPKLTEIKCWENELMEIKFPSSKLKLKTLCAWTNYLTEIDWEKFSPESLIYVSISNNNLKNQDVSIFNKFTNLEELYIGNDIGERLEKDILNRFYGSTKSLKNLTKLKKLQIEGTDTVSLEEIEIVSWGKETIIRQLELTKEEAEKLHWARQKEFSKILNEVLINHARKQLGLNLTFIQEKEIEKISNEIIKNSQPKTTKLENKILDLKNYWNQLLEQQKEDKQNEMIAKTIPLERLYVIRGNMKQFLKKWGEKVEEGRYERKMNKFLNYWKNKERLGDSMNNANKLRKLKSPKEINESWWTSRESIYTAQFVGRGAATVGAILLFQNIQDYGGGILGVYPFAELLISNMEKSREDRKNRWKEFLVDTDVFSDNYNELLGILAPFKDDKSRKGKINEALKELNKEVERFLRVYDENKDNEISVEELTNKRDELVKDLNKAWVLSENATPQLAKKYNSAGSDILKITSAKDTQQAQETANEQLKNLIDQNKISSENLDKSLWNSEVSWESHLEKLENKQKIVEFFQKIEKEITTSKLLEIVIAIEKLEKSIISYRKFSYYEEIPGYEGNKSEANDNHQKDESQSTAIDLDKHFEMKDNQKATQEAQIETNNITIKTT